jgi:hypothetical protein
MNICLSMPVKISPGDELCDTRPGNTMPQDVRGKRCARSALQILKEPIMPFRNRLRVQMIPFLEEQDAGAPTQDDADGVTQS